MLDRSLPELLGHALFMIRARVGGVPALLKILGPLRLVLYPNRVFAHGNDFLFSGEWWITIFPGAALVIMVLAINLLGDWLRDALNPRLR